eukprot:CAMPEP_0113536096 /NCGR_PEP_ID=MMETSP0015_2-20120614/6066_1 /TAXON_ID=2838 /ORGANISM="Odontella" /LENGTH=762 /DNA_ID=CAMNT_0000435413 /DNA_START=463 /DNA_END=2752 /DNA_ORIENTATION=+ /assembly_acc=CAM_ASM_000160
MATYTTSNNKERRKNAVNILTQLLEEERRTGKSLLKQGIVFNVFKACRHLDSSKITALLLEKSVCLLEENTRLWDTNMIPPIIGTLTKLKSRSSMEKAQSLLRDLEENIAKDKRSARLSLVTYTTMLRCYANRGMVKEAQDLLQRMSELYECGLLDREPDKVALKCVKDAKRRSDSLSRQAKNATVSVSLHSNHNLIGEMQNSSLFSLDSAGDRLGSDEVQKALNSIWWHINKDPDKPSGVKKALLLLNRLLDEEIKNNAQVLKRGIVFNVLRACAKAESDVVADDLEATFGLLETIARLQDEKVLRELLVALARCKDRDAPNRAEGIVKRMKQISPNSYHYNAVLLGYAKRGWAKNAEKLLNEMQRLNKEGKLDDGPNIITYNVVLDSLFKSGDSDAVKRAELIWKKMMKNSGIKPDMFTFASLFNLYAQNAQGDKAERLLEQIVGLHKAGKLKNGPNEFTYRCVIDALAKSAAPERAEEILYRMRERGIEPNRFHYCSVLSAYARNGKARQCERLIQRMYESREAGILPDAPDVVAFNSLVYAWTNSGAGDAHSQARSVMDDMEKRGIRPNVVTYNCLLCAAKDGKEAEQMLQQMKELHEDGELEASPNTISYNYCLYAMAKPGADWTVVRAESLVNEMRGLYESDKADTKPNMITYRNLLQCYANWGLVEDAERLLHQMKKLSEKGDIEYSPDKIAYDLVIDVLRKSDDEGAKERADVLQKQVEEMYGEEQLSDFQLGQSDQADALLEYMGGFGTPAFL